LRFRVNARHETFAKTTASTLLGISMGLLWFSGTVLYGVGAAPLGTLGGIVGRPIFMTLDIIVALFWGAISGEWKGPATVPLLTAGWELGYCSRPLVSSPQHT
jgi:hypothetical protein